MVFKGGRMKKNTNWIKSLTVSTESINIKLKVLKIIIMIVWSNQNDQFLEYKN
jgi:hypothetical protein